MLVDKSKLDMLMAKNQLTVKDFCTRCKIDKKTYFALCRNGVRPGTVGKIAEALQVEVEELIVKEKDTCTTTTEAKVS